ncbi:MAG: hypothetical protein ACHQ4H_03045 [Ktedonobacterales bacterium]
MAGPMSGEPSPGQADLIHLAYRRGDVDDTAGRIYDRLVARYGRGVVARDLFRQVDELPPEPAAQAFLDRQMERVAAQVIVIGPRWLDGLARPRDIERVEVAAALSRRVPLIPVLAEGTPMPHSAQMPDEIAPLVLFNAAQARLDPDFDADMRRLLATVEGYAPGLAAQPPAPVDAADSATARRAQRPPRSPLRIVALASVGAALLVLVLAVAVAFMLTGVSGTPPSALHATPAPTATYLPTPSAAGTYFSPLTNGAPDWLTGGQCQPKADGLHLVNSDSGCDAPDAAAAGDGDLSVTVRQISGDTNAPYGLYFREAFGGGQFYALYITSGGEWSAVKQLYKSSADMVTWQPSPAIHTGLGAINVIEARIKGTQLTFLVNGQQVGAVSDSSIPASGTTSDPSPNTGDGIIGHAGADIVFTDFRLKPLG